MANMKRAKAGLLAAGALATALVGYNTCFTYVKPHEIGVKKVLMSPGGIFGEKGLHQGPHRGGLKGGQVYFAPAFFTDILTVDGSIQTINYNRFYDENTAKDHRYTMEMPMQRIQTTDQYQVDTDFSIIVQIEDAHKVVSKFGPGDLYKTGVLPSTVPAALRETFSMRPEDFFQVDQETGRVKREVAEKNAVVVLDKKLDEFGIGARAVLMRYPEFAPELQAKFENTSVQEQLVYTNQAEARLAEKAAEFDKLKAVGEQAAEVRKREGEGYRMMIAGKTDAYKRTRESDGDRIEKMAEAEKTRLINESYQGAGSERLVSLEMVRNLKLEQILAPVCGNQGFNPLDTEKTIQLLGGNQ